MGIMIEDPEIIALLEKLAAREGTTKAQALVNALRGMTASSPDDSNEPLVFSRDRVTYRTYRI